MQIATPQKPKERPDNMVERIYQQLKDDIFEFRLLPGDRFSENEVAERVQASRTPVRQALYRLEREGYLQVYFRSGWQVRAFDFNYFEELYDVRIVLESAAIARLEHMALEGNQILVELKDTWLVNESDRLQDPAQVSALDERFHCALVEAAGNAEMARMHFEITEKIRIIRRLDFTQAPRVDATYSEHGQILNAILQRRTEHAQQLLHSHIQISKQEVRKITLHRLHIARQRIEP
ncbi:GntR family transcriptional regulator [Pseudomonas sp. Bc-h]|jgi:DNA-binding GntR family transcriptional regulator|uniref:GntR family transcriptional regulator n=1 Tax=unclassified Pseudomonas TaxID=196821 RepID=UPI0009DA53A8|nr:MULTISPECIES: GntR family transcriptional regulator [unclassified Pseudomonas]MDE1193632.1 GntR family transcriptional regulator [Pseudomonas sp.]OQR27211.1 GntR family transcriptional regulator [Pseudomonas sp. Bc-h]